MLYGPIYNVRFIRSNICWATNVAAAVQKMLNSVSCDVERWKMPFNMLKVVERCWTKIELGSIPFNKLSLVERLQPIVFEFGVPWLRRNINMAAEELESADHGVLIYNTSQLINLYETFPCLYDIRSKDHKNRDISRARWETALVEIAATGCSMLRIWFYFLTIHASKFCGFFVFFVDAS